MPNSFTLKGRNILSNKDVTIDTSTSGTGAGFQGKGRKLHSILLAMALQQARQGENEENA